MAGLKTLDLTALTVDIVGAYFIANSVEGDQLPGLIRSTYEALQGLNAPAATVATRQAPAVGIQKSLSSPGHILSLIDGKPYKALKRHLATHGLTPAQYRERYNLPGDYPMVAKAYSEQRRAIAMELGFGRTVRAAKSDATAAAADASELVGKEPLPRTRAAKKNPVKRKLKPADLATD